MKFIYTCKKNVTKMCHRVGTWINLDTHTHTHTHIHRVINVFSPRHMLCGLTLFHTGCRQLVNTDALVVTTVTCNWECVVVTAVALEIWGGGQAQHFQGQCYQCIRTEFTSRMRWQVISCLECTRLTFVTPSTAKPEDTMLVHLYKD